MTTPDDNAIECEELARAYTSRDLLGRKRETTALQSVTFAAPRGIVFGLLGPNGAGKTTTVRILSTLLTPSSGQARVLGHDVVHQADAVRKSIGLILGGERGLYARLTGRENLRYFAAMNYLSPHEAKTRIAGVLDLVGLSGDADRLVQGYSRGMRQRLHIARGLLPDPDVVFMDEPTIGLDPFASQEVRRLVPDLVAAGKTVLLTTHYMFEADQLCHRIAMINHGQIVAIGTPAQIKGQFSKIRVIEVTLSDPRRGVDAEIGQLPGVQGVIATSDGPALKLSIQVSPDHDLREAIAGIIGDGVVGQLVAREPSLEEAYLSIMR